MFLNLPLPTLIVIGVISFVLLVVIIIVISRSTCCRGRKDKRKAKREELDRFLTTDEESEDELLSRPEIITDKHPKEISDDVSSAPEDTFYFDDVTVQGSIEVDETPPPNVKEDETSDLIGLDEAVVLETQYKENQEKVEATVEPPAEEVSVSVNFEGDLMVEPPIDDVVIDVSPPADPVPPAEPSPPEEPAPPAEPAPPEEPAPPAEPAPSTEPAPSAEPDSIETVSDEVIDTIDGALTVEPPLEPQLEPAAEPASALPADLLAIPGISQDRSLSIQSDVSLISVGSNQSGLDPTKKKLSRSSHRISSKFSENAILKVNLEYVKSKKCLKGSIVAIESLNFEADHVPHEINFHLRFFPNKKFHMATKHKPIQEDNHTLNLTFTMGPVYPEALMNNKLRIKLYGKKAQRLTRSKCYGECALDLYEVVDKDEAVMFEERLVQSIPGAGSYSSDSDGVMLDD